MSKRLEVEWAEPHFALDLQKIDWKIAGDLCEAILRYADTGDGEIRRVETPSGLEMRLYLGEHYAWLAFDPKEPILHALRARKVAPRRHLRSIPSSPPSPVEDVDVSEDDLEP